ncbi:MAG: GNAT family N-acetyltransferase [Pseudomonadota bacterium]|jgi:hypothetical protein|uniref:hypothetical protein n=1 Tax=Burkholderiaceae TaxID=119060 RepID=UPI00076B2E07|nr:MULTISPECIES: hypothetical protein [Burkholderiaceae]AME26384.1 hypothetical protein AXG89_21130 [Burkholderia sp. PAMC 26561]AMM17222.1 hypothetical protein AX768_23575 [Burkholderia sp. PAMC 28687]MDP9157091.1 GNAT family N-acetyltransferase [Pseudomonadota bacterium]
MHATAASKMIDAFHASHVEERQEVEMWLETNGDCAVALEAVWSEGEHHRGHARAAMERLVALADRHGVMLSLVPKPLALKGDGVDRAAPDGAALEAFYERLGFERSGGEFEGSPVLVRAPRKVD